MTELTANAVWGILAENGLGDVDMDICREIMASIAALTPQVAVPDFDNPADIPRIARGHEDVKKGLDILRDDPSQLRDALSLAGGALLGGKVPMFMAAVLTAQKTLFPDTDFSS